MFSEFEVLHEKRIRQRIRKLGTGLLAETVPLEVEIARTPDRVPFNRRQQLAFESLPEGAIWGQGNQRAWFRLRGTVPNHWKPEEVTLWLDTGTEALVRDETGRILHALVSGGAFDDTSWRMARPFLKLGAQAAPGGDVSLWAEAACMTHPGSEKLDGPIPEGFEDAGFPAGRLHRARLGRWNQAVWSLYLDMEVLADLMASLPRDSVRAARIFRALRLACDSLGREPDNFDAVRQLLAPVQQAPAAHSTSTAIAVGHGHLDSAWLWSVAIGRDKVVRTFANQLALLDEYPDYVFGASAMLHYNWIKEGEPELYERIKAYVKEGRWEVQGAMWVESDVNLPSGESLIRQILFGRHFCQEEFGFRPQELWLPDVFGYPASLPEIMRACGVSTLITQKISWSQFHRFPHTTFRWVGHDDSEVIVHFPPEDNYCSALTPSALMKAESRFAEKDRLDRFLTLFGYGDGGGGPHPVHIERGQRLMDLEGVARVKFAPASEAIRSFHQDADLLDRWKGELYLELHRKTLTTQAFIKKENRRMEARVLSLEMLQCIDPKAVPSDKVRELWETLLLHQFHDIIPGSGIREVYEDAAAAFAQARALCNELEKSWAARALVADSDSLTTLNPLAAPWSGLIAVSPPRADAVLLDQNGARVPLQVCANATYARVSLPALGFQTFRWTEGEKRETLETVEECTLENDRVRYQFDDNGQLVSAVLKSTEREFVSAGETGNVLNVYHDDPTQWEAWDLDCFYEDEWVETARCCKVESLVDGPAFQELRISFQVGNSKILQSVRLRPDSARLDFVTEIDWQEDRRILRVDFPETYQISEVNAAEEASSGEAIFDHVRNYPFECTPFQIRTWRITR